MANASADHLAGSDLDLYAFDADGNLVDSDVTATADEHVDLPPGDYDVYVVPYSLPAGPPQARPGCGTAMAVRDRMGHLTAEDEPASPPTARSP
ncbi:hypothetical protein [Streptomyces sp. T028]|uniref:hypothetical protein n=1 Tax=Streptomyces sp. T028 TaxID=3394379 RepID=UPI003A8A70FB